MLFIFLALLEQEKQAMLSDYVNKRITLTLSLEAEKIY